MRIIWSIIQKEFAQFFRDKANIRMLLVMPVVQLILLPMAADYEVENIKICIIDQDHSEYSRRLIQKIEVNHHFILVNQTADYREALKMMESDQADIALTLPHFFERDVVLNNEPSISASVNAVNGQRASIGGQYLLRILNDFNREIRLEWIQFPRYNPMPLLRIEHSYWFNPTMNYQQFMVPGILVILLTMVGFTLSALNLVKEKELGTIEQINVSPIRKYHFLLGKLIPFWILSFVVLSLGLLVAFIVYNIVPSGSYLLIYLFASVYLLAVLGLGLLISIYTETQQQTMLLSFFLMMVFILLSGLYTPVESMPEWAQMTTWFNPVAYFVKVMRMIIMKGSGFTDILPHLLSVLTMALILISWAIAAYRKKA
ncbi:MAG: ABC transporter permease [Saprospiraceae bacterium]|nr:ABC transporter permease [Saprospiraceae bacterium]